MERGGQERVGTEFLLIVGFAVGTKEHKEKVLKDVCGTRGFVDEGFIRFNKLKVGTLFRFLLSPVEILYMAVTSLVHTLAFQPLLAASAHRSECGTTSMRGLGSMVRVVDLVLRRLLWVNVTGLFNKLALMKSPKYVARLKQEKKNPSDLRSLWSQNYILGHRGLPTHKCQGVPFLSRRVEKPKRPAVTPRLLHLYGSFYQPAMEKVVSRTMATISSVCGMEAADRTGVLSPHHRSLYPLKQDSFLERIFAAQFLVHHVAISAADCILKHGKHAAIDPLGLLAGLYDVLQVEIKLSELEIDADENDGTSIFYIATDQAIASANILLVQLKELLVAHGDGLYQLVNDPLKSLLSTDGMRDLEEFAEANEVPYSKHGEIVQPSSGSKRNWFPKPVTAIGDGRLARLALLAGARPTNNNSVESRWSLLTNRFHGMVRNARAEYMSAIFRKQDHVKSNLRRLMGSEEFLTLYHDCREFRRRNKDSYKAIFSDNTEETQRKLCATIKPKEKFKNSNIGTLPDKEEQIPCKEKGQVNPKPKRKGEGRMKRYEESGSDESSESAVTPHLVTTTSKALIPMHRRMTNPPRLILMSISNILMSEPNILIPM
jgi:hypothetical protein